MGGEDRLFGSVENNILEGGADNDVLMDDSGNDTLDGGTGVTAWRAARATTSTSSITWTTRPSSRRNGGFDTVRSTASNPGDPLSANIEALILVGDRHHDRHRQFLDNVITGNAGISELLGGAGNDTLFGWTASTNSMARMATTR